MLHSRGVDKTATTDKTSVPRDNCCCCFLKVILDSAVVETSVIDWKIVARVRVLLKFNKIFLGTDSAASSQVGQILLFRVEGSIPYSTSLKVAKYRTTPGSS